MKRFLSFLLMTILVLAIFILLGYFFRSTGIFIFLAVFGSFSAVFLSWLLFLSIYLASFSTKLLKLELTTILAAEKKFYRLCFFREERQIFDCYLALAALLNGDRKSAELYAERQPLGALKTRRAYLLSWSYEFLYALAVRNLARLEAGIAEFSAACRELPTSYLEDFDFERYLFSLRSGHRNIVIEEKIERISARYEGSAAPLLIDYAHYYRNLIGLVETRKAEVEFPQLCPLFAAFLVIDQSDLVS